MKIYFDGGSWCWGSELEDPTQSRYSKIICDHYGIDEYNISKRGACNSRLTRQLLVDHKNIKEFDLVIIQLTYPQRQEYYDKEKKKFVNNRNWVDVARIPLEELRIPHLHRWNPDRRKAILENTELNPVDKAWLDYYKYVYEDEYGDAYEDMHATAIRSYCKANNVPLILATIKNKRKSKLVYDIYCGDVPRHSKGHPTKEGHAIHAKQMIDFYENTLLTKHK